MIGIAVVRHQRGAYEADGEYREKESCSRFSCIAYSDVVQ